MSKRLIGELKRVRSILSAVTGFEDDDQEYVEDARKSVNQIIEAMLAEQPAQRKPLTVEQIELLINGRGDEDDDDYVEPTGDGFGLTDADLVRLIRRVEAAHGIKENT